VEGVTKNSSTLLVRNATARSFTGKIRSAPAHCITRTRKWNDRSPAQPVARLLWKAQAKFKTDALPSSQRKKRGLAVWKVLVKKTSITKEEKSLWEERKEKTERGLV